MAIPAAAGLIAGPLLGGVANALGQGSANRQNLKIAREQMAFQERMANTSYQRAVADMRMAGINPALAWQQGGAASPGGASATMQNVATGLSPAISSAIHGRRLMQELKNMQASEDLISQQWAESRAREDKLDAETGLTMTHQRQQELQTPYLRSYYRNLGRAESSRVGRWSRQFQPVANIFRGMPLGLVPGLRR